MLKVNVIITALFLAVLSACVTQRRCNIKFPPGVDSISKTIIRDSIVYKDTTIYITLRGETVIDSVIIPCPPPDAAFVPDTARAETSLAIAKAWWSYPALRLLLIQKDTTITRRLDAALKEAWHWRSEYEKIKITPAPVRYIPGVYKAAFFMWIGVIILLLSYVVFRILKK